MQNPILSINDLRAWISLGCSESERMHPQMVSIDIDFVFKANLKAMQSDRLDDTICYGNLSEAILKALGSRSFQLIEHLAYYITSIIDNTINAQIPLIESITTTVNKTAPPVPGIHGGVKFTYQKDYREA